MKEIWDLVHVIEPQEKGKFQCLGAGCNNDAVVIWATNLEPDMLWFGCIACQEKEFGGWPEGVIPPTTSRIAKEDDVSLDRVAMMAESDNADDSQWEEPLAYNDGASDNEDMWDLLVHPLPTTSTMKDEIKCSVDHCPNHAAAENAFFDQLLNREPNDIPSYREKCQKKEDLCGWLDTVLSEGVDEREEEYVFVSRTD